MAVSKIGTNALSSGLDVSSTNISYTGTLTGGTGVVNIGSGQVYKDSSGNVGIGTNSPGEKLTINGNTSSSIYKLYSNQSTPTTTDAFIYRPADNTLAFGTASAERARITSGGRLNIGTAGGSATRLEIEGGETQCVFINTSATDANYKTTMAFTDSGGTTRGTIRVNNSATQYNTSSDYRLKENIQPMTGALAKVQALKPCTFNWKIDGAAGEGFIAHELAEVAPDAVAGEKDAVETYTDKDGNEQTRPVYQGIDTSFLVATLTAAIQELKAELDSVKAELAVLKGV